MCGCTMSIGQWLRASDIGRRRFQGFSKSLNSAEFVEEHTHAGALGGSENGVYWKSCHRMSNMMLNHEIWRPPISDYPMSLKNRNDMTWCFCCWCACTLSMCQQHHGNTAYGKFWVSSFDPQPFIRIRSQWCCVDLLSYFVYPLVN